MRVDPPPRSKVAIAPARVLLLLSVLPMVLGLVLRGPGVAEPVGIDQGIFLTAGWGLQRGLSLYRDLWDQKPPGIHLTYLLGLAVSGGWVGVIVWLDVLVAGATTILLFDLGRRRAGWGSGVVAGTAYALLTLPAAIYTLGGFLERAVPECFIVLFVTAAVWMALAGPANLPPRRRALAAGVLAGAAIVYKPTAVVFAPVVAGALWADQDPVHRKRSAAWFLTGLAAVPALVFLWLAASGTLGDAWIALVEYNRSYLSDNASLPRVAVRFVQESARRLMTQPLWAAGAVACVAGLYRALRARKVELLFAVACLWGVAALASGAASGVRVFNSYFIPPQPALALMVGTLPLPERGRSRRWSTLVLVAATLAAVWAGWRGYFVPRAAAATSADVRALLSGSTGSPEYLDRFGGFLNARGYSARANAELASWIRGHTAPEDRIFIFGMAASVYFLSQRLPSNRFLFVFPPLSGYIARPAFTLEGLAADLARVPPRVFVLDRQNRDSRTGWRALTDFGKPPVQALLAAYDLQAVIGNFSVYVHRR